MTTVYHCPKSPYLKFRSSYWDKYRLAGVPCETCGEQPHGRASAVTAEQSGANGDGDGWKGRCSFLLWLHWLALDCCLSCSFYLLSHQHNSRKEISACELKSSKSRVVFTFLLPTPPLTQGCLMSYSRLLVVSGCCCSLFLLLPDSLGSIYLSFLFPYLLLYVSQKILFYTAMWKSLS